MSVSGSGSKSPLHAYYCNITNDYELNFIKPEFIYADGDGSLLLTSALSDSYDDEWVYDRLVVNDTHGGILTNRSVFDKITKFISE